MEGGDDMARYIDADALIKKIFPYDVVNKKDYAINAKAVADAIDNTPTADVVQRAVVEELKKDRYQIFPDGKIELLPRSDVEALKKNIAREIFAEIESIIRKHDERPKYQLMFDIWELKEKYTGDNNDG